jgi:SAM-dependent methyltransferase
MINDRVLPDGEYYSELRMPMISLITNVPKRVLEVGCASGQTLAYLRDRGAEYTVGIERSAEVAALAQARSLNQVVVGDIETLDLDFEHASFDLLIVGHVLEHLADPWKALRRLRPLLKCQGQLVGALPNVRHHSVVFPLLLSGKWEYQSSGVMDWTHLRFFSRRTAVDLLEGAGFEVNRIVPDFGYKSRMANSLTCNVFQEFLAYAYNFSALKTTAD